MGNQTGERRRAAIVEYLGTHAAEHVYPPSYAEIAAACGLSSTSVVAHQLLVLETAGAIRRWRKRARTVVLVEANETA